MDVASPLTVSIRAYSREDATVDPVVEAGQILFQSARPRGRTRRPLFITGLKGDVSIRASSREDATVSVESNINQNVIFAKARRE